MDLKTLDLENINLILNMNLKYHNDININFNVTTKLFNNNI